MPSFDTIAANPNFTTGRPVSVDPKFLPEPERRERYYTLISVDDHIVEPPNMFEGRLPKKFAERAPTVISQDGGSEVWTYDNVILPNVGFNAVVGRPISEYSWEPARFDQMRRGAWDVDYRVKDMDINGIFASVNFPSFLAGFAGQRIQLGHEAELGLATARAWNAFVLEEWHGRYPDRIIPMQIPLLYDIDESAREIELNAERGFRAVAFSEGPDKLGLPSIYTDYWDPFLRACEETETAVCLHFGSSGQTPTWSEEAPPEAVMALCAATSLFAAADWLFSRIPLRFPKLKIVLSEGGIGWVAGWLDRLDHGLKYQEMFSAWDSDLTPAEVFQRNFWLCAIDDPSAMANRERIGIDRILLESDYPHADSTWPDTQKVARKSLRDLPSGDVEKISWRNASTLFRHPVPEAVQSDPDAF